jgi:hypothetical protein
MKTFRVMLALCISLLIGASCSWASNTASHSVTVTVDAINELAITGGDIELTINAATAGSNPTSVQNTACGLQWTTNEATKKITVETDQASPTFTLKALATSVSGGTAAAEATLSSTTPADIVTGVSTTLGNCTIRYSANATAAEGTGSDVHTVTYTITAG